MTLSLRGLPHHTLKSPAKLYTLPSPINITTMVKQHTKLSPNAISPGKLAHQAIHCPAASFGPLPRGSVTNSMLITAFDTYLTPRSPGAWVWAKILLFLNVAPFPLVWSITHISMNLADKYVNLKEPYNQGTKEQVTTKGFWKEDRLYMKFPTSET